MRANLVIDARETNTGTCGSPALLRRRGRSSTILLICGSALDPVAWRFLRAVKGRSVSIGKRTSDNGVDVHGKRVSPCTVASVYVVLSLMVTASRLQLACRTGDAGGGRERPPFWTPWISTGEHRHVHADAPLQGGALPSKLSLAGRPTSAATSAADQRIGSSSGCRLSPAR